MNFSPRLSLKYIKPEDIPAAIQRLHPGMCITRGTFGSVVPGLTVKDIEWNHLDQAHRVYLHDAYQDAVRLVTGKSIALSISKVGSWPFFIQVADVHLGDGVFYQTFCVFGLIICHQIVRLTQLHEEVKVDIEWFTASHRWLKFLHKPFNRRLLALQEKQNAEDWIVRKRRLELRKLQFRFKTDEPDFLNANVLSDMVIFPINGCESRLRVSGLPDDRREKIKLGPIDLFAQRISTGGVTLWPAICPHEGADLTDDNFCDQLLACPWHGRKFKGVRLEPEKKSDYSIGNLQITLDNDELLVRAQTGDS